jgi:hypothetical protein
LCLLSLSLSLAGDGAVVEPRRGREGGEEGEREGGTLARERERESDGKGERAKQGKRGRGRKEERGGGGDEGRGGRIDREIDREREEAHRSLSLFRSLFLSLSFGKVGSVYTRWQ